MAYTFPDFLQRFEQFGLESLGRYYSIYPADVKDNDDPQRQGRIKVRIPQLTDGNTVEEWAYPVMPLGSGGVFLSIPRTGDKVWVAFRGGNVRYPLWIGSWLKRNDLPDGADEDYPLLHVWQTPEGNRVAMNDKTKQVYIIDANGNEIRMQDGKINATVRQGGSVVINGQIVELNGSEQFAVRGDDLRAELLKLDAKFDALIAILQAWVPVPSDGGAALKTALAPLFGLPEADFTAILSQLVKLS